MPLAGAEQTHLASNHLQRRWRSAGFFRGLCQLPLAAARQRRCRHHRAVDGVKSLNSMKVFVVGTLSIGLFSSTALIPATAAAPEYELPRVYDASMPRDQQITLAESAAPAEVSSKATVYVLGPKGYEKARKALTASAVFCWPAFRKARRNDPARNDDRAAVLRRRRQPHSLACLHARWRAAPNGKSEAEIKADIASGYKEGRLEFPGQPGFLYMMSSQNRLGAIPSTALAFSLRT